MYHVIKKLEPLFSLNHWWRSLRKRVLTLQGLINMYGNRLAQSWGKITVDKTRIKEKLLEHFRRMEM